MDLQQLYTDLILEYNRDKTNKRKVEAPTIHEHGHNPSCGDDIDVEVKVEGGIIKDLAYTGTGCAISQASTAMMAELLQDRTVDEAIRLCKLFLAMIRGRCERRSGIGRTGSGIHAERYFSNAGPREVRHSRLAYPGSSS